MSEDHEKRAAQFREAFQRLRRDGKVLVGQETSSGVLAAFFAEGHALLEGAPGAKDGIVRTLAAAAGLSSRGFNSRQT